MWLRRSYHEEEHHRITHHPEQQEHLDRDLQVAHSSDPRSSEGLTTTVPDHLVRHKAPRIPAPNMVTACSTTTKLRASPPRSPTMLRALSPKNSNVQMYAGKDGTSVPTAIAIVTNSKLPGAISNPKANAISAAVPNSSPHRTAVRTRNNAPMRG